MKPPRKVEITPTADWLHQFLVKVEQGGHFPENTIEEIRVRNSKELLKYLRGLYKETPGEAE